MLSHYHNRLLPVSVAFALFLAACGAEAPPDQTIRFEKTTLSREFFSEGIAAGDLNRDGRPDLIAGDVWFEAPDWVRHEIVSPPSTFDPATEYSDTFLNFALDVDLDRWIDVVRVGHPATPVYWFRNPGTPDGRWTRHTIIDSVGNESPQQVDIDRDGRLDLLLGDHATQQVIWLRAPTTSGDTTWTRYPISAPNNPAGEKFAHGIGFGDINGDTRRDVFATNGWWEAPADPKRQAWTFHPADLGQEAAQMYAIDADLDGDADVVSSSAHRYGIWWHEQIAPDTWTTHTIFDAISQTHALGFEDIDDDNDDDFVTGKRYLAHNGNDPGSDEPAVLYWFEFRPDAPNGPEWVPNLIDSDSGVGEHLVVDDITGDGRADIAVANKKGVFVFIRS